MICKQVVFSIACLLVACLHADEGDARVKIIPVGTVYQGDFFGLEENVEISGEIDGDAYIMAGQVIVDGVIHGDLLVMGGSIDVSGRVTGSIRALGGQVLISGQVGNNVTAVSGNAQFLPTATIGGNVVATAGNVYLSARVGGDTTVIASYLRVSSMLHKRLQAYVGNLRLTSKALIGGDLDYRSGSVAVMEPGAQVKGVVTYYPSLVQELIEGTWIQTFLLSSKIIALLMNFLYTFAVGMILMKLYPKHIKSALHSLQAHPWKALTFGLVLLILLPLISLILLMTILGVPFALTLIAANIIGFYTAKIYSIVWASNWLFGKFKFTTYRARTLLIGLMCYFALTVIPYLGFVISCAAMLFGLGAGVLSQHTMFKNRRGQET